MEENKKEGFFKKTWRKTKEKAADVWEVTKAVGAYCVENKEVAVVVASSLVSVVGCGVKVAAKGHAYKKDKNDRKSRIYDPHMGTYHYLRKPMTKSQEREFNRRVKNASNTGETYFDILDSMNVLE